MNNTLLIWFIFLVCTGNTIRTLRTSPFSEVKGWIFVYFMVFSVTAGGLFLFPHINGFIGGVLWLLFVFIPLSMEKIYVRLYLNKKYKEARILAYVMLFLHPADGWIERPHISKAMVLAKAGKFDEAKEILSSYKNKENAIARECVVIFFTITQKWDDLISYMGGMSNNILCRSPLLIYYLRAIGETGDLNGMIKLYIKYSHFFARMEATPLARLFIFSFCGRVKMLDNLFLGPLSYFPEDVRNFWTGTALMAAGEIADGRGKLKAGLLDKGDILSDVAFKRRDEFPPVVAGCVLDPYSLNILKKMEMQVQQEGRYSFTDKSFVPYVTYGIIALNLLVHLSGFFLGITEFFYLIGALIPSLLFSGQYWRLISAQFLHFGFVHLSLNMLCLLILGPFVEKSLGRIQYFIAYLISGTGCMMAFILCIHLGLADGNTMLVGASGGIMGLIGITGAVLLRGWLSEKASVARKRLIFLGVIVLLQSTLDLLIPEVAFAGHLGGAITGFIVGIIMVYTVSKKN